MFGRRLLFFLAVLATLIAPVFINATMIKEQEPQTELSSSTRASLFTYKSMLHASISNLLSVHVFPSILLFSVMDILKEYKFFKICGHSGRRTLKLFFASIAMPIIFLLLNWLLSTLVPSFMLHQDNGASNKESFMVSRIYLNMDCLTWSFLHMVLQKKVWSSTSMVGSVLAQNFYSYLKIEKQKISLENKYYIIEP